MQILATKKFEDKLKLLGEPYDNSVRHFFASIKLLENNELLKTLAGTSKLDKILVYKIDTLRLFYNFTKDDEGKIVLVFLDLTFDTAPLNQPRDPRFNSSINPRFNSNINPRFNSSINPRFNSNINPRFTPSFFGYYFYDLELNALEFVISAKKNILLFFDFSSEFKKYAVKHDQNGYVVFDVNGEWIGHIESDSQTGFNYFDTNGEWVGFLK